MFINISNHPAMKWSAEQVAAATKEDKIVDLGFPQVDPKATEEELSALVWEWAQKVRALACEPGSRALPGVVVHLMGETGFVCRLSKELHYSGATVVHSTTAREVVERNGVKESVFRFVQFRRTW